MGPRKGLQHRRWPSYRRCLTVAGLMCGHGYVLLSPWLCRWLEKSAVEDADASSLALAQEWLSAVVLVVGHLPMPCLDNYVSADNILSIERIRSNGQIQNGHSRLHHAHGAMFSTVCKSGIVAVLKVWGILKCVYRLMKQK